MFPTLMGRVIPLRYPTIAGAKSRGSDFGSRLEKEPHVLFRETSSKRVLI